ncbi:MAG: pro-sigmaK processing inhibitor BofA family protein [Bacillota bacterium]
MEWKFAFIVLTALIVVFVLATFAIKYIKLLYHLLAYTVVGTVLILLLNIVLERVGMHIALNPATVLAVGVLKIPGVILMVVLNYYFA